MAVFRVERNSGYTVMSNHHLRNKELTLKAKGLLSQMLSLPEDWDYPSSKCSFGCPMRPCGVSQNPFAFSRRSFAREIPVLRPSSARLISFIPANSRKSQD